MGGGSRGDASVSQRFGDRVRDLRKRAGLSQEKLGERCDLHRTEIGRLEQGEANPQLATIEKVARGLGVELGVLFEGV